MVESYRVGRVPIHITTLPDTRNRILSTITGGKKGYVCVSNMRTVVAANRDPAYLDVMEHSLLNIPDGTPLVWCGKAWGKPAMRVVGLDLFTELLETGIPQFFLGDTEETLSALTKKVVGQGCVVAGTYSPPFVPLEKYDLQDIADRINKSGASLVWTSLRAPKQDYLAAQLLPFLHDGIVLVGVGAAFRLFLGEYQLERGWIQKLGLGGLKMRRNTTLWKELIWYVKHCFHLVGYLVRILFYRLFGRVSDEQEGSAPGS